MFVVPMVVVIGRVSALVFPGQKTMEVVWTPYESARTFPVSWSFAVLRVACVQSVR